MGATRKRQKGRAKASPRQEELPLTTQPTLKQVVALYVDHEKTRLRRRTLRARALMLERAAKALPERPTAGDIQAWLGGRVDRLELVGPSANQVLKVLHHMYRLARDLWFPCLLNVVAAVPRFPEPTKTPKALPDPARSWPLLLAACKDVREQAFISIMRRSGLRPGEALALEPRHFDFAAGKVKIEQSRDVDRAVAGALKTDTSKAEMDLHPETARLAKQVVSLMRAEARGLRPAGERTQRGKAAKVLMFPYYTDGMAELLARLRAAVPEAFPRRVRGVSGGAAFHVFRHTFATELARRGLREQDLMRLLRHKNFATTTAYVGAIRGREQPTDVLRKAWADEAAEEAAALGQAPGIPTAGIGNPGQSVAGGVVTLKGRGK